jgi:transposase
MEACATAHCWGREIETLGHTVRLTAPKYVKPFVKRQKNDVADAEAIVVPKGVIHVKRLAAAVADEAIDLEVVLVFRPVCSLVKMDQGFI